MRANELEASLVAHDQNTWPLPAIRDPVVRRVLLRQLIDSLHRVRYPAVIAAREVSARRAEPADEEYFDPLRAATFYTRQGNIDEACWLIFLFVHFGKHSRGGYRYARDIYGRLGQGGRWDWPTLTGNLAGFVTWLEAHHDIIRNQRGPGGFGSHRKYESLKPEHTGRTITTYAEWVDPQQGHVVLLDNALSATGGDVGLAFKDLYDSMDQVVRFGRTARFDYLTMLGKLGISSIAPASVFLEGATGPLAGARLLYGVGTDIRPATLEHWLRRLDLDIQVGSQALEDALCNWQKSPNNYRAFRG